MPLQLAIPAIGGSLWGMGKTALTLLFAGLSASEIHRIYQKYTGQEPEEPAVANQKAQDRYLAALSDATYAAESDRDEATPALMMALAALRNRLGPAGSGLSSDDATGLASDFSAGGAGPQRTLFEYGGPAENAQMAARALSYQAGKPIHASDLLDVINEVEPPGPSDARLLGFSDYYG